MDAAGLDQGAEAGHIQFVIAEGVETQREPVTDQVWLLIGSARSQRFLKMRPGDAQIVLSGRCGQVGPQQAQQKFAAVSVIRLDKEIGQQSDRFAIGEGDRPQLAMIDLQAAQ